MRRSRDAPSQEVPAAPCRMSKPSDVRVIEAALTFIPIATRVPLKFGAQTVTRCVCARVRVRVEDRAGRSAEGWGETPLSVAWVWPSTLSWEERERRMCEFTELLARELVAFGRVNVDIQLAQAVIKLSAQHRHTC